MYNDIDLNLEVDNNNENSVNVENLVNVSFNISKQKFTTMFL